MIEGKEVVEAQIKDYDDILKSIRQEVKTVKTQISELTASTSSSDTQKSVELIADALLVNSLHNNLEIETLSADQHRALDAALSAITSISNPRKVVDYPRMKQGFTQLFNDLCNGSEDFVPGNSVSFKDIHKGLTHLDESTTGKVHEEAQEEVKQVEAEPLKQESENENWAATDGEGDEEAGEED